jgi:hypothetical protein
MFSREKDPGLGRSGRVVPRLESLEDRCCPSSVTFLNHILQVTGNAASASTMIIRDDGDGDVTVTLNGKTTFHSGVQELLLASKGGNDTINYDLTSPLTKSEVLKLNLGDGSDKVKLDFTKGVSAPSLKILVDGGGGNQTVETDFGSITNTNLQLTASLGSGWDHFAANFNGNLAGIADAHVSVTGGVGVEGVNVEVHGNIASTAQFNADVNLPGSAGHTVHVDYTGKLSGRLSILEQGGPGWDWLESVINLTPGSTGSLYDHELGGGGADLLMMLVHDAGSHLRSLDALINGGAGLNTGVVTPNVRVLNAR